MLCLPVIIKEITVLVSTYIRKTANANNIPPGDQVINTSIIWYSLKDSTLHSIRKVRQKIILKHGKREGWSLLLNMNVLERHVDVE